MDKTEQIKTCVSNGYYGDEAQRDISYLLSELKKVKEERDRAAEDAYKKGYIDGELGRLIRE
jgi:hypothetical protein